MAVPLGKNIKTGKNYTVMLIDDSSTVRVALRKILASENFDIILEAENGKDALLKLGILKEEPDIIFLDFEMPKMNGIETLEKIRGLKINSQIIVITAFSDKSILGGFLKFGVNAYVVKPIERKTILERLAKVLLRDDYFPKTIE